MSATMENTDGTLSGDNWSLLQPDVGKSEQRMPNDENRSKKCLLECKILTSVDNDQYIKLRGPDAAGLPYSAMFRYGSAHWELHGAQCLVTIGSSYTAKVTVELSTDLNNASDFEKAKDLLLQQVVTEKVLEDQLLLQITSLASAIEMELTELGSKCGECAESGQLLLAMVILAEKHSYDIGSDFCKEMCSNEFVSSKRLKVAIVMYSAMRNLLKDRNIFLKEDKWSIALDKETRILEDFLKKVVTEHDNLLLENCTTEMKLELEMVDPYNCLLIRITDVTFFKYTEWLMKGEMLEEVLPLIRKNFIHRIATVDYDQTPPVINPIFFYVYKSLVELANRVEAMLRNQNPVQYDGNQWKIASGALEAAKSGLDRCLVNQMDMLVNFANHYEPGKPSVNDNYPYEYQIECFKDFPLSKPDEHLWANLMDAGMVNIFQPDFEQIDEFSEVFKTYLQFISSTGQQEASPEARRMVTHIVLEFAAVFEQLGFGQDQICKQILKKQLTYISQAIQESQHDYTELKRVSNVFKDFWIRSKNGLLQLKDSLNGKYLSPHFNELRTKLLQIITCALDKIVCLDDIIKFVQTFNELSMDLEALGFEWYVRVHNKKIRKTLLEKKAMKCLNNRLSTTDDKCFLVAKDKYDLFIEVCANEVIPKHYQVEIVKTLLDYIIILLEKRSWNDGTCLTGKDQLTAAKSLINAIRTSFLNLNDQPEYVNFTHYYKRSTKPFKNIIKECDSMTSFTKRIKLMMNSFEYIQNQELIDVNRASSIFSTLNAKCHEQLLKNALQLYVRQFEKHMRDCDDLHYNDKIKRIVRHVNDSVIPIHTSKWTAGFKQNSIPLILAGVRAVWSVLTSEDVLSPGKVVQPHLHQILTVLKYLCVDKKDTGVDNHLAHILIGQGESVVLGLVAAVLALFGHKVEIVYHSKHMAKREADKFNELYESFSIKPKIFYKTIDDVVNERMDTFSKKAWLHMSKSLGISRDMSSNIAQEDVDLSNTVLLMNEFDIFLEKYYGSTSYTVFAPHIKGLGQIQQQIWELVKSNSEDVEQQLESFIESSSDPDVVQLKSLIERPGSYKLFTINHDTSLEVEYSNKTFFADQFSQMIKTAKDVHNKLAVDENFKLNYNGVLTCRNADGEFHPNLYCQYFNAFVYFKLQKDNFMPNLNGSLNFGYLPLDFSSFSYAKLPDYYPLFLCVTGTSNGFKLIQQKTIMPAFFGDPKLKFNQQENFLCLPKRPEWKAAIVNRINILIGENRSVVVFFKNKAEIEQFRLNFDSQIDRLNEITNETNDVRREQYIAEAGVPGAVTLATRDMGRGVDYRTTVAVKKNGGIHVIQTFFSLDENEETHIQRCTTRKGDKGSYEMIVCLPELVALELADSDAQCSAVSYAQLDKSRRNIAKEVSEDKMCSIEKANRNHEMLVKFYENV